MRKILFMVGVFLVPLAIHGTALADQPDEPRAVVEKAIQSGGGAKKISQYQAVRISAVGTVNGEHEFKVDGVFRGPDQFRITLRIDDVGDKMAMTMVINGDQGWSSNSEDGAREMPADELTGIKNLLHAVCLADLPMSLKTTEYTLRWLEKDQAAGEEAVAILAKHSKYKDTRLFYDKSSGLLAKSMVKLNSPNGKDDWCECFFTEYRDFADVKHFTRLRIRQGKATNMEFEIKELKLLTDINAEEFAKPR